MKINEKKSGNPAWEKSVREMFFKLRGSPEVVEVKINGIKIRVLPDVFSPAIFFESKWYAEKIATMVKGKKLLEIGPGTGIVGLFSALNGATVTAIDINDKAVENTKINFGLYNLPIDVRLGNVYEPLKRSEKFDFIFWNHPFNKTSINDTDKFFKSVFDFEYQYLRVYIGGARKHLLKNGKLLLGTSNIADLEEIRFIADEYKFDFILVDKIDRFTEVDDSSVDFRIYEFSLRKT